MLAGQMTCSAYWNLHCQFLKDYLVLPSKLNVETNILHYITHNNFSTEAESALLNITCDGGA